MQLLKRLLVIIFLLLVGGCRISHEIEELERPADQPPLTELDEKVEKTGGSGSP